MKSQKHRRETDFLRIFRRKQDIARYYKEKYGIVFSKSDLDTLSLSEFIALANEKILRAKAIKREHNAAIVIQSAYRQYIAKLKYKEYEQQYKLSQERIMAAMKIQLFYRSVKNAKELVKKTEEKKVIQKEKYKMFNMFTDYVIRYKYLKPRLFALLKQLDRLLKEKRKDIVVSAAIFIQYQTRKWLKKLRAKRKPNIQNKRRKAILKPRPAWQAPIKLTEGGKAKKDHKKIKENLSKLNKKIKKKKK